MVYVSMKTWYNDSNDETTRLEKIMPTIAYDIDVPAFDLPADAPESDIIAAYTAFLAEIAPEIVAYAVSAEPSRDHISAAGQHTIVVRTTNLAVLNAVLDLDDIYQRIV